jgi:hypothetical protein
MEKMLPPTYWEAPHLELSLLGSDTYIGENNKRKSSFLTTYSKLGVIFIIISYSTNTNI